MRNHPLESRVRENRTHGSEGGEGESPSLPLSSGGGSANALWIPACAGMTAGRIAFFSVDNFRRFRLETACG
jgi:hypothetical protein